MDPYRTLGVPRGSSRAEVKDAFRIRAWSAHPDRGGEPSSFIQLCAAYQQVLAEWDRNSVPAAAKPPRAPRHDRAPKPPDPGWEPELVLLATPPDPRWDPDLVLLDEPPGHDRCPPKSPDPRAARDAYASWFRQVSARAARGSSVWQSGWARAIGMMILLSAIVASVGVCWIVWHSSEPMEAQAGRTVTRSQGVM